MIVDLAHDEAGTGLPFVLLHAFPLSSAMWTEQREQLAGHCRIITPDLRGFGGSALGDDSPSLDASADDVAAHLDRLGLDRVVLGGMSMGGYVTMSFLRRHPERVSALVLADTKATADSDEARANRERIARAVLGERGSNVLVDEVLPTLLGPTTVSRRPDVLAQVRRLVEAAPPEAVAWTQRAMAARPDSFGTLRACDVPALVLVGEEDRVAPPGDAEAMADALRVAELVRLPAVGHLSAVEDPAAFAAAVSRFLTRL